MTVEVISCKTVLTSETTLYQRFFNPLFLLGSFRHKNVKISQVIFRLPVSINDGKHTWKINGDEVTHNFECNHEEADT